jgi:hypothetical protein
MARGVSQDRLQAMREVVSLLGQDPSFRESIPVNPDGERPIVVATPDERMDDLLRRVVAAGAPPVTVCVRHSGSRSMLIATLQPAHPADGVPVESQPIPPSMTVGEFSSLSWSKGTAAFHLELEAPKEKAADYELEFA